MNFKATQVLGLQAVFAGLLIALAGNASAQDWHWTGLAGGGLWGTPGNWQEGSVPPTNALSVWLNAGTTQTIAAGTVESPGIANVPPTTYGSIYGPEFGGHLNIYGTLKYHWVIAAVQNNLNPAVASQINMYDNSVLNGVNLAIGHTWWFQGGPNAVLNMYSNANANAENLWWGGHVNVYGHAVLNITNLVVDLNQGIVSDITRWINMGGGKLILPAGFGPTVTNWLSRGILLAYGNRYDTNGIIVTDQVTNTIVSTAPLGGALQRIYFQPLPALMAGSFRQARLVGDYPGVGGALLNTPEPGVDPATLPGTAVFTSSNTNIFTVSASGMIQALRPGIATLTATLGSFTSTNALTVTVLAAGGTLVHRYSFNELAGTTAADSVGGLAWDGTLNGAGASFSGGQVVLDGNDGTVTLPAGVVSGLDAITIEAWVSFGSPVNSFSALYAFGNANGLGQGVNYISLYPHTGPAATEANFGNGDPGTLNLEFASVNQTMDGRANTHIVAVYYPFAGTISLYTNSVLAAVSPANIMTPLTYQALYNVSSLNYVLGADPFNMIGQPLWFGDPYINASVDEFRIYSGPLTPPQIRATRLLGPNQPIGSNSNVTLSVALAGSNLVITWPTNSALVTLTSKANLDSGAWDPVVQPMSIVSGKFQVTVPATGARFFRLER